MATILSLSMGWIHVKLHKITILRNAWLRYQTFWAQNRLCSNKAALWALCSLWQVRCERVLSVDSQVTFRCTVSIERPSQVKCEIGVRKTTQVTKFCLLITDSWITALVVNLNSGFFFKKYWKKHYMIWKQKCQFVKISKQNKTIG